MSLRKLLINEVAIHPSNNALVIVDVQPEYNFDFDMFAFMQYINQEHIEGKDIIYLYNGYDTLGMIKSDDLKNWLFESSDYDEQMRGLIYDEIQYYDKGYAFFRSCMDEGIDDVTTVALINKMMEWDITDTRDLTKEFWIEFVSENKKELYDIDEVRELLEYASDMIYIPELMEDVIEKLDNVTLVGGGVTECLREVIIALMVLNKNYNVNNEFTF